jgi:hypothetical protein
LKKTLLETPPQLPPPQIALGAPLSAYDVIVQNLIPVTLGNWVGGFLFVGTAYSLAYGTPGRRVATFFEAAPRGGGGAHLDGGTARKLPV